MFDWLESTSVALWVKESWGFPFALTLHTFGAATMVGLAFTMCLCTLGMFTGLVPASLHKLIPFVWFGLGVQMISGTLLVTSTVPARALLSVVFWTEMALIATGAVTTGRLARALAKETDVQLGGRASARAVQLASAAAIVWIVVLLSARLRGSLSSSYGGAHGEWFQVAFLAFTAIAVAYLNHLNKRA